MREDTIAWLAAAPVEALACRELRHAWPRAVMRRRGGRYAMVPPSDTGIVWESDVGPRGVHLVRRTMTCTAGCGVRRVETFHVKPGAGLARVGTPRYLVPQGYRRRRPDPDTPLESLDGDLLRGTVMARLYPSLRWS